MGKASETNLGKRHQRAHKAFLDIHPEFKPVEIYEALCDMLNLGAGAVERGLGKLFKDGKLKMKEKPRKSGKRSSGGKDPFR